MANTVVCGFVLMFALFCKVQSDGNCPHTCIADKEFQISGQVFTCSSTQSCNKYDVNNNCHPCVDAKEKCKTKFTCTAIETEVKFGDIKVTCPEKHICNSMGTGDCIPCVHQGCPEKPYFKCDPKDHLKVVIMGITARCERGTVCNIDNLPPCEPCIAQ